MPELEMLVPFLVARSGRALDEFARWVAPKKPMPWLLDMIEYLAMSAAVREELLLQHVAARKDDPEIEARRLHILQVLLDHTPEVRQALIEKGIEKGRLEPFIHLFERRLARPLTSDERNRLAQQLHKDGADRLADMVLDLSTEALTTWLATKTDR